MKPLSMFYYLVNNKRKLVPVILSISLSVMFFYFLFLAGTQSRESSASTYLNPLKAYSRITSNKGIPEELVDSLNAQTAIEKILPLHTFPHTNITRALGNGSAGIFFVRDNDIKYMMGLMNLKLTEGRLPEEKNEILLHWSIAANNKLKLGDIFKDTNEIQDNFKIVGILDGSSIVGFVPTVIQGNSIKDWLKEDLIVIPKKGKLTQLNKFLDALPNSEGLQFETLSNVSADIANSSKVLSVVMYILVIIVVAVLCITLGNTSSMYFYQRKNEFGVLSAIGYTRWEIGKRVLAESILAGVLGYISGVLLSLFCASAFNILLWNPMGESVPLYSSKGLLVTAIIPVFVVIASVGPILRLLKKKDLINIIEAV